MKKELQTTTLELILPSEAAKNGSEHAGTNLEAPEEWVPAAGPPGAGGLRIGTLKDFEDSGTPLVVIPSIGADRPMKALTTVVLDRTMIGRAVALQFEGADPRKPVILGLIQGHQDAERIMHDLPAEAPAKRLDVELDGERLLLTADKEIVLRCGKSSITLTRAGKVLIRGAYLLSRSSGVNRIKGGSVQIN